MVKYKNGIFERSGLYGSLVEFAEYVPGAKGWDIAHIVKLLKDKFDLYIEEKNKIYKKYGEQIQGSKQFKLRSLTEEEGAEYRKLEIQKDITDEEKKRFEELKAKVKEIIATNTEAYREMEALAEIECEYEFNKIQFTRDELEKLVVFVREGNTVKEQKVNGLLLANVADFIQII